MNKIEKLRKLFSYYKIDGYIIPKNDEFFSEYTNKNKDRLYYISNFSGSAGTALILKKKTYIFVDGRYTLQAKKESGINFKVIEIHKTTPLKILKKFKKKLKIGFDPKLSSEISLVRNFKANNTSLLPIKENLIDKIWLNKSTDKIKKFYILKSKYTGQNFKNKIRALSKILKRKKINKLLITAPENLAWILNIRGNDSKYSPLPNCHAIFNDNEKITLIVDKKKIDNKFKSYFKNNLSYVDPSEVVEYFDKVNKKEIFLIDKHHCSFFYKNEIKKRFQYIEAADPIFLLKSKKNKTEIKNSIKSHIFFKGALAIISNCLPVVLLLSL